MSGLIRAIQSDALAEAEALEKDAADLEAKASAKRGDAMVLRQLDAVAKPWSPRNPDLKVVA